VILNLERYYSKIREIKIKFKFKGTKTNYQFQQ
jgi:hypothetical protein